MKYNNVVLLNESFNDNPVDTRRRFNVDTSSYDIVRGRINVETTLCVYGEIANS